MSPLLRPFHRCFSASTVPDASDVELLDHLIAHPHTDSIPMLHDICVPMQKTRQTWLMTLWAEPRDSDIVRPGEAYVLICECTRAKMALIGASSNLKSNVRMWQGLGKAVSNALDSYTIKRSKIIAVYDHRPRLCQVGQATNMSKVISRLRTWQRTGAAIWILIAKPLALALFLLDYFEHPNILQPSPQ